MSRTQKLCAADFPIPFSIPLLCHPTQAPKPQCSIKGCNGRKSYKYSRQHSKRSKRPTTEDPTGTEKISLGLIVCEQGGGGADFANRGSRTEDQQTGGLWA